MLINIEQLREDLKDYYGTAMFNASPMAVMDLSGIERASNQEIVDIAREMGIDLRKYAI